MHECGTSFGAQCFLASGKCPNRCNFKKLENNSQQKPEKNDPRIIKNKMLRERMSTSSFELFRIRITLKGAVSVYLHYL